MGLGKIDKDYYHDACKRFKEQTQQVSMLQNENF